MKNQLTDKAVIVIMVAFALGVGAGYGMRPDPPKHVAQVSAPCPGGAKATGDEAGDSGREYTEGGEVFRSDQVEVSR